MRIRREQVREFDRKAMDECEIFVREFVTERAPEVVAALPKRTFEQRVRIGIARAGSYDIGDYGDIAAFVYFMFIVCPDFDEYPLFQSILTDEDVNPDDRMTTLVETATDADWAAAGEGCEPDAWDNLEA